ncbi:hypothetical protein [Microvirga massiliensis]|uniref:hypothetical protein n=1 Tax=Microvirga massiliensis TaxID=1033741 RepID=UPI00062BEF24|nr:hypothetical protein [Microvirga massiliensis]
MIDPSLRAVLRSRYTILRFFALFGILLGVLLLLLLVITTYVPAGSTLRESAANFLGNFAATVAVFIVTYLFYVLITPPGLRDAEVVPLRDVEIGDGIINLPANASDYWFWGRSGSYFRSVVLPRLDNLARRERRHVRIRLVMPDPDQGTNSILYKRLKQGLGEAADDNTLPANVLATISAVVLACSRNPYLKAEIGLCPSVPVLRYDLSNSGALITRDAKKLPAILTNSGNPYFEMFRDAVENELAQSRKVTWDLVPAGPSEVTDALDDKVLTMIKGLPSHDATIVDAARHLLGSKANRYGK